MSDTTRPREEGEIDAVDYYFVNKQPFEQMVADNRFAFLYSSLILHKLDSIYGAPSITYLITLFLLKLQTDMT